MWPSQEPSSTTRRSCFLDEPLGALDLQLRRQMQHELKRLQKKLGITFIYITHDQEEAINMSDTIVVMRDGRFEQIGSPSEVYDHPKTSYVASFVGSANVLKGTVEKISGDTVVLRNSSGTMVCDKEHFLSPKVPPRRWLSAASRSASGKSRRVPTVLREPLWRKLLSAACSVLL